MPSCASVAVGSMPARSTSPGPGCPSGRPPERRSPRSAAAARQSPARVRPSRRGDLQLARRTPGDGRTERLATPAHRHPLRPPATAPVVTERRSKQSVASMRHTLRRASRPRRSPRPCHHAGTGPRTRCGRRPRRPRRAASRSEDPDRSRRPIRRREVHLRRRAGSSAHFLRSINAAVDDRLISPTARRTPSTWSDLSRGLLPRFPPAPRHRRRAAHTLRRGRLTGSHRGVGRAVGRARRGSIRCRRNGGPGVRRPVPATSRAERPLGRRRLPGRRRSERTRLARLLARKTPR